jgi:hypothetical protein
LIGGGRRSVLVATVINTNLILLTAIVNAAIEGCCKKARNARSYSSLCVMPRA